ncbi:hypothetical protein AYI69_g5000 [Smittium culicis]|uniref:Uncharacterized protein n=1 Tax=Smittium culicis TaxID=133412 RepID=A0A1R1Y986_9FUNG|nr:hypothetical protein AYI69_g5000 [Smittium culicis]
MVALSETSTKIFNPLLRTLCRILDLFLTIPKISPPYLILASNTPRKKSTLQAIGTDLEERTLCPCISKISGCSNDPPTARAPQFEIPRDISLSLAHFTTSRFSLSPTSESASSNKPSASRIPGHPCLTPLSTFNKGDIKVPILTPASGDL